MDLSIHPSTTIPLPKKKNKIEKEKREVFKLFSYVIKKIFFLL